MMARTNWEVDRYAEGDSDRRVARSRAARARRQQRQGAEAPLQARHLYRQDHAGTEGHDQGHEEEELELQHHLALYCYHPAPPGSTTSIVDDGNFTKTYKQSGGGFGSFKEKPPGRKKKVLVSFFRFNNQTSSPQGFWGTDNTRLWNKQAWGDFVVSQQYPDGRQCQTNSRDLVTGQANSKPPSIRLKLKPKKKK